MKIPLDDAIRLLHAVGHGTLATQSRELPGYPFASALPFVPDGGHRPLFLVSGLAEHTKNLLADPRVSLLVLQPDGADVQTGARMTLVGDVEPVAAEPPLLARYCRYAPEAERYLALGDFALFRLAPQRVRLIAGFGRMGWLEADAWHGAATLTAEQENTVLAELAAAIDSSTRLLGVDCYGIDLLRAGRRLRLPFAAAATAERVTAAARAALAG